ncbi:MAG: hypothetical protein AB1589_40745, partial [Cyanobacteriota bacterium]
DLEIHILGDSLGQVCRVWSAELTKTSLPAIIGYAIPSGTRMRSQGLEQVLQGLMVEAGVPDTATSAEFDLGNQSSTSIFKKKHKQNVWNCSLEISITDSNAAQIPELINRVANLCRQLLTKKLLLTAKLSRGVVGLQCVPTVPIAGRNTHLIVTTKSEVDQNYNRPEDFWLAGWSETETYDDKYLLMRGMDANDNPSFLWEILPHQWEMARAAKPGLTKYYPPKPEPEEQEIFEAGEPYLHTVGYIEKDNLVQLACHLPSYEHIQGWEIYYKVANLIKAGHLPDGRKVDTVKIVFSEQEMAEQEKRPLLDVGAKVFYMNSSGENVEITE